MRTVLRLFLEWGITFDKPYTIEERAHRRVAYADKDELEYAIQLKHKMPGDDPAGFESENGGSASPKGGGMAQQTQSPWERRSPLKTERGGV